MLRRREHLTKPRRCRPIRRCLLPSWQRLPLQPHLISELLVRHGSDAPLPGVRDGLDVLRRLPSLPPVRQGHEPAGTMLEVRCVWLGVTSRRHLLEQPHLEQRPWFGRNVLDHRRVARAFFVIVPIAVTIATNLFCSCKTLKVIHSHTADAESSTLAMAVVT